jgi:hypothetical protein
MMVMWFEEDDVPTRAEVSCWLVTPNLASFSASFNGCKNFGTSPLLFVGVEVVRKVYK